MISHAFIIKNFIPLSHKVQIIHEQYGKIVCMYSQDHQARQLTTGSIILCHVESTNRLYRFEYLEIVRSIASTDLDQLQFVHEMMKICLKLVPNNVVVPDIFEFLMYVYQNVDTLSIVGRKIVLLRLFLLCEVLPSTSESYQAAMQDPFANTLVDHPLLDHYVQIGWHEIAQLPFLRDIK